MFCFETANWTILGKKGNAKTEFVDTLLQARRPGTVKRKSLLRCPMVMFFQPLAVFQRLMFK